MQHTPNAQSTYVCVISYLQLFAIPVPPGSSVHGIFQARILAWVAISYSRGSSWPRDQSSVSTSPVLQADSLTTEPLGKPYVYIN